MNGEIVLSFLICLVVGFVIGESFGYVRGAKYGLKKLREHHEFTMKFMRQRD